MTPAERWSAAVELQRTTVAELDPMGVDLTPDQSRLWCDKMNHAQHELTRAYDALDRIGQAPTQEQWYAAWSITHDYQIRIAGAAKRARALRAAERLRSDAASLWPVAIAQGALP